ncbi:hypothetical protein SAMN05216503_1357 [Polaribacter sp. KT25b]|uniref:hypothetical protein n=1 Tax=Polaribacter sp. KT25b TaxID=1855336 RepID=UPI000879391D|nr:hypothetical protein [Polaribacter sp. KT25b]SDR90932.1 hypothetical protein SAMN05216503_1357 [Polaribacter sp. KT25b]
MRRYIENFTSNLNGIDFKTLENSKHSVYGLSEDLNLTYVNPEWMNFAKENGINNNILKKFPLGEPIVNAFLGEWVKNFYTEKFMEVLKTGKPWHHEYECSSVDHFREFHQDTYPLKNGKGLIISNSLTIHLPMSKTGRKAFKAQDKRYVDATGFVTQCSNCRCTQRVMEPEIWDWVPEWVNKIPKNCSHSICPICFDYFWKI